MEAKINGSGGRETWIFTLEEKFPTQRAAAVIYDADELMKAFINLAPGRLTIVVLLGADGPGDAAASVVVCVLLLRVPVRPRPVAEALGRARGGGAPAPRALPVLGFVPLFPFGCLDLGCSVFGWIPVEVAVEGLGTKWGDEGDLGLLGDRRWLLLDGGALGAPWGGGEGQVALYVFSSVKENLKLVLGFPIWVSVVCSVVCRAASYRQILQHRGSRGPTWLLSGGAD